MVRKFLGVSSWFCFTLVLLVIELGLLLQIEKMQTVYANAAAKNGRSVSGFGLLNSQPSIASSGDTAQVLSATVVADDARPLLLDQFIKKHNSSSPLLPYTKLVVQKADQYSIDYRLTTAIAECESNLGLHVPSSTSHNLWGIAVYTGQQDGAEFNDWPHAIDSASSLAQKLYTQAAGDMKGMGAIWAPPSVNTGYSWTNCVTGFMDTIL